MDSTGLDKSGWVNKKAQVMRSWNPRYIVADPQNVRIKYYKERPSDFTQKERGELLMTNCTVSVDQTSSNDDVFRFLITTPDHRKTFHLEVETEYEMSEWIRAIRLISDLGVTKQAILEETKMDDNFECLRLSVETLLQRLDTQSTEARRSLDRIAKQKWKSKTRLVEVRDEMEEKHRRLRVKQQEMKNQEKAFREELSQLNQALYVLQQQVRRSNEIQQKMVVQFGNNQNLTILEKARAALAECKQLLSDKSPDKSHFAMKLHQQQSTPLESNDSDDTKKDDLGKIAPPKTKAKGKGRTRSYSDLTVSKSDVFEDEMAKLIVDAFPGLLQEEDKSEPVENKFEAANDSVIAIFELYHRYYVEVHLPREMELRKVRTKCEQKYNSLRYVSNKKELARREEDEIDWVMMEMKRAIDRLNKEGVLAPDEKHEKADANHYKPPNKVHRDSAAMIPVLAHRSTWSEASDTIFQLNVARQQQYQATKDLEESLKSRELVKSWYEDKVVWQSNQ